MFVDTHQTDDEIGLKRETQKEPLSLPPALQIFTFASGDITHFPQVSH